MNSELFYWVNSGMFNFNTYKEFLYDKIRMLSKK